MTDDSHTAHEPHPTAAMDRQLNDLLYRPNEDTVFMSDCFNEDEVVHIELVGKRRVYSEAAYNKLLAERDRLREALKEIADENRVAYTATTAKTFATMARKALQEARDD